ncbi:MAG: adenylate kinase [Abditibacteriales bacterium]|nr:adenylate kinase [Abditibacteriales bacterium]MDW8365000.1 adenylate kinase [Abditibacteriales bacterium]
MRRRIVFLGPPGAGKGTQAQMLAEFLGVPVIATGDLLRAEVAADTPLGRQAREFMEQGALVPDPLVMEILKRRLAQPDCEQGFILDGFPRTLAQAQALEELLGPQGRAIEAVLELEVPEAVLVERFSGRRVCRHCGHVYHLHTHPPRCAGTCDRCGDALIQRADDTPATVRTRLQIYHQATEPLIHFYRERGLLHRIDGSGDIDRIQHATREVVVAQDDTQGA